MASHEFHPLSECPAHQAWLRYEDSSFCELISVAALLSRQEFNGYQENSKTGGLRHARVNDKHCGDDHFAGNVVVEGLRDYSGDEYDYEIFRPTPDSLNPWEQITKEN